MCHPECMRPRLRAHTRMSTPWRIATLPRNRPSTMCEPISCDELNDGLMRSRCAACSTGGPAERVIPGQDSLPRV
jgi:hypothetical protein